MAESQWAGFLRDVIESVSQAAAVYLPSVLSAIILIIAGWGIAFVARITFERLIVTLLRGLSWNRTISQSLDRSGLIRRVPRLVGGFLYWSIFLFFIAIGIERLDLAMATTVVGTLAAYLPRVLLGVLLLLVGILTGQVARSATTTALQTGGFRNAAAGGRIVQGICVLMGAAIGADQMGIQSTLLTVLVAVIFGTALGSAALAFAVGSKDAVGNLLASSDLMNIYQAGQLVRIGAHEGRILEITRAAVILESKEGRIHVPARRFMEETSILLVGKS